MSILRATILTAVGSLCVAAGSSAVRAQPTGQPGETVEPIEPVVAADPAAVAQTGAPAGGSVNPGRKRTDHDDVVGRWGVEARHLGTLQRTAGQDKGCGSECPVPLNAFGVRRWYTPTRAWSAGLVLAVGGGSSQIAGRNLTWDTYLGVGPTGSLSYLLGNWRHVAVSFSPQADFVFFMPGGTRSKTYLVNARALIEGEMHLGFIQLPSVSVGATSGLALGFKAVTSADKPENATNTATEWSLGVPAPQTLRGLVTNLYLRIYL